MTPLRWMIYGAYGFTGKLIAREAVRRGYHPLLAGRDREKLLTLGNDLMLPVKQFSLSPEASLERELEGVDLVVNIAGPFVGVAEPLVSACLRTGTHYIDTSGERDHFRYIYEQDAEARKQGVALIPGCGFDVIPTDSIAACLKERLPEAVHLELAVDSLARLSAGTAKAAMGVIAEGGFVRVDGGLQPRPIGRYGPNVRFHRGERRTILAPFADLESAWRTTSIPSISTYLALPPGLGGLGRLGNAAHRLLSLRPVHRLANAVIDLTMKEKEASEEGFASIWGRVTDRNGRSVECWMQLPEPYHYTAFAVLNAVERLTEHPVAGALTPTQAFGPDFALSIPGTVRQERLPV